MIQELNLHFFPFRFKTLYTLNQRSGHSINGFKIKDIPYIDSLLHFTHTFSVTFYYTLDLDDCS